MAFIKVETEDMKIEETFRAKHEETETQTNIAFIKVETEDVNNEDTETQTEMAFIKEESEDTKSEEAFRVKHEDTEEQTDDCPLCYCGYHQLSQHLRVFHKVTNKKERQLLLALLSGRVNVRKGTCPLPACGKVCSRLDRHLKSHTEMTKVAQREAMKAAKRKKILLDLAELRASEPAVPMVSSLDLEEAHDVWDTTIPQEEAVEQEACSNICCQGSRKALSEQVADLNKQVDTLSTALRNVTRRYRLLRRRSQATPSDRVARVTSTLLSAMGSTEENEPTTELSLTESESESQEPLVHPPSPMSTPDEHPYLEHATALNKLLEEYRGHQESSDPTPNLKNNVASKIYRIKSFIGYMSAGQSNLDSLMFLDQTARIRAWPTLLSQAKIVESTVNHYVKNVAQFIDYVIETPPPTCCLSKKALVAIRREVRLLIRSLRQKVVVHEVKTQQVKEGRLIPKGVLQKCRSSAKQAIPQILDRLESTNETREQWRLYGYLTAYLMSIYGHRLGIFQNLKIQQVEAAKQSNDRKNFVINITTHKTNQAFGATQLSLTEEEYGWFQKFLALRSGLPGGKTATCFFFTSKPSPCKNLNKYFQEAWASMRLPGMPTFTDVRTSIATHARDFHKPENYHKVAQFMCHDTTMADRFYALHLNPSQASEHCRPFELALEGEDPVSPETPEHPTTSRPLRARKATKRAASPPPSNSPSTSNSQQAREGPGTKESTLEGPTEPKRLIFSPRKRMDTRGRGLLLPVVRLSPINSQQKMLAQKLVGLAKKKTAGPH